MQDYSAITHREKEGGAGAVSLSEALAGFAASLDAIIGNLSGAVGDHEQDFLDLGASLMQFTMRMGVLSGKASRLAELTGGGDIQEGIRSLASQLDGLGGVCKLDASQQSEQDLQEIRGIIKELNGHVESFGRVVKKLTMLGISTRIESARLGSQGMGFATLADDVEKLAGKIVANSERIMDKSRSLSALVDSAAFRTSELSRLQGGCSDKIVTDLGQSLEGLEKMVDRSGRAARSISRRLSAIHASVSEFVASMQFHDIVRQQVEHVEEAFQGAREMFGENGMGEAAGSSRDPEAEAAHSERARELISWIHDLGGLQRSQLDFATRRFAEAVQNLVGNLVNIGDNVVQIGREMSEVIADEQEGEPVLERIESSALEVISCMRDFTAMGEEISVLMGTVAETIKEMSVFLSGIEEVGAEIELISLNASVKAAHTGDDGKALGVLAQSIQRLSMDAMDQTRKVSEVLLKITECSRRLEENSSEYVAGQDLEELVARQEAATEDLRGLNERVENLFGEVSSESRELGQDILQVADGTRIHETVGANLAKVSVQVDELIRDALEALPDMDEAGRSERLKELLGRYTMEAERMVHLAEASELPAAIDLARESEVEFFDDVADEDAAGADDGVELFDDADGGVDLFDAEASGEVDASREDGGVELFDDGGSQEETAPLEDGPGVELFDEEPLPVQGEAGRLEAQGTALADRLGRSSGQKPGIEQPSVSERGTAGQESPETETSSAEDVKEKESWDNVELF